MSLGGPAALFGLAAAGLFFLAGVMLVRSRLRAAPEPVAPEAFFPADAGAAIVPGPETRDAGPA
jgi:hypothetical protein